MKGQIQTQKYGFTVNLHPEILWSCISSTQKYGWQFYFSHKFDIKELFLEYYIIELRENGNKNSYPPKMGSSRLQILDPKVWLWNEISDPKHGTHTPYPNMTSTLLPWEKNYLRHKFISFGGLVGPFSDREPT